MTPRNPDDEYPILHDATPKQREWLRTRRRLRQEAKRRRAHEIAERVRRSETPILPPPDTRPL